MTLKSRLRFLGYSLTLLCALVGCGTTSQMYLQSARYTNDESYGIYKHNPIILKYSEEYNYNAIIEEYIGRLFTPGSNMQDFSIINSEAIFESGKKAELKAIKEKTEYLNMVFIYDIISEDQDVGYTLYFKLSKKKEKLFVPHGLMFSMLCGDS